MTAADLFTLQADGTALTISVNGAIGSLANDEALRNLERILEQIQTGAVRDVVIDFQQTPYFGSCMLEMMRRIWNELRGFGGRLVLCNLSPLGLEIIQVAKFDQLWPVVASREEALRQLESRC